MKRHLIVTLIILIAMIICLDARRLKPVISTSRNLVDNPELKMVTENSAGSYGQNYYRKNSRHRMKLNNGAKLVLKDIDANVKVVTWKKEYAEVEIMKISPKSVYELENKEVMIQNNANLQIGTCCNSTDNSTMIDVLVKLPVNTEIGNIENHQGNLSLKGITNSEIFYSR